MFKPLAFPSKWLPGILCLAVAIPLQLFSQESDAAPAAEVANTSEVPVSASETGSNWFVELNSPPTVDGSSLTQTKADKQAFRQAARAAGLNFTERRSFDVLWNGLSINISPSQLSTLSRISGVKAIYPVQKIAIEQASTPSQPDLSTAIQMTGADFVQNTLGYTGQGIRVGVIDTGIDYNHPAFGGNGVAELDSHTFPQGRVVGGYDFVGDGYDSSGNAAAQVPHPDAYPDDCAGHGSHVAGIIGANGGVKGVAPGVTFYAYRVFGCTGTTDSDVMIAAMERALADGVQVVNMSIGAAFQTWPQYPTAQASDRLVNKGVVVVASIGNSGANGIYSGGAPGVGQKVIGAASVDNTFNKQKAFSITPDGRLVGFNEATAAPPSPSSGTAGIARWSNTLVANDGCNGTVPANSMSGRVALIRRGTCSFFEKSLNAQNAGAVAVVLFNNVAGSVNPTVAGATPITIPVVAITAADGATINTRLNSGNVDLTWGTQTVSVPSATGGLISSFSSYGLAADLSMKPDISAPGGNIFSTYPLELGGFTSLSGTSMASPHVAGVVALYLQAHPHTSSQAMRSILQNSASPGLWWGNPGLGFLDNVQRQGAGLVKADKAILATTSVEPGKLSLGESQSGPSVQTLHVSNNGNNVVTYALSHAPALATGPDSYTPAFFAAPSSVSFAVGGVSASSLSLAAGQSADVTVTIAPNAALADGSLYGGYIVLTPDSGNAVRVPFVGYKGDYQARQVLFPTAFGFPWLAKLSGTSLFNQPNGATYSLQGGDIPYFLIHLDHQSRWIRFDVTDSNGKSWHRAYQEDYLPRNSARSGTGFFFTFTWDGNTFAGNKTYTVPNGTYTVTVTVEKALGSDSDVETWISPPITIARP
jgi:minor extracellular serine protease Vpr